MARALFDYQAAALKKMRNGCILNGGVGSGKSLTAVTYYYALQGGEPYYIKMDINGKWDNDYWYSVKTDIKYYKPVLPEMKKPCDLYIITTARKRDTGEWEDELVHFFLSSEPKLNRYSNKVVIDSWNNIKKYISVENAFFIFDEQKVVGNGTWVKSFLKIARKNKWILLSATPGDTWMDYVPVFIANGYYRNRTDFTSQHAIYSRFTKYPKIERYINEGKLIKYKKELLIEMTDRRTTISNNFNIFADYDKERYDFVVKNRWNIYTNEPIINAAEYCLVLRRIVNSSEDRQQKVLDILKKHPKAIIFYSHNYELEILRKLMEDNNYIYAEWNGHKHQPVPIGDAWVYLVEYTAGCEGWNCITTDTTIFYSLNYSYKVMQQASGRINRLNTPYTNLYYYKLLSKSKIDTSINATLLRKKKFNQRGFAPIFENKKGDSIGRDNENYTIRI